MVMRRAIQRTLRYCGYELNRITASPNPFTVQRRLITASAPIIFDIGAHVGDVATIYRQLFPDAWLHCFEPSPQAFQKLLAKMEGDGRCVCHQAAVSDRTGAVTLNANTSSATNSLLTTDKKGASFWGDGLLETASQVAVTATTVDAYCTAADISHIDILKMDVQGAEFSILIGAEQLLSRKNVSLIYSEIILCPTYEGQRKLYEYLALLDSQGYEFIDFFNPVRRHNQLIQADAIFVTRSLKESLATLEKKS